MVTRAQKWQVVARISCFMCMFIFAGMRTSNIATLVLDGQWHGDMALGMDSTYLDGVGAP